MSMSLTSIHQPLTDFFLSQFRSEADSPIEFRFDKYGSVVSDQDFLNPVDPKLGYLPALAMEKFSDLVNHIPIDGNNGLNILLSNDSIDTAYFFHLLSAATPFIPNGTDDTTKQSIINAFSTVKAECIRVWNNVKAESMSGLMLQYKPSLATPENWYDLSKNDVWTNHTFQVTETSSESTPSSSDHLWRLRLNNVVMRRVLKLSETGSDDSKVNIADRVIKIKAGSLSSSVGRIDVGQIGRVSSPLSDQVSRIDLGRVAQVESLIPNVIDRNRIHISPIGSVPLHDTYLQQYHQLNLSQRITVDQYLSQQAPTQTVKTTSISISFDYCLVRIRRPWYVDAFINDKSWCLPNVSKGQMTTSGVAGNLSLLPIGFIAIRNLSIEANWDSTDVTNAATATNFGPFKVDAQIVNNKLSHSGLQIIGWLLQQMPDLPPNPPE